MREIFFGLSILILLNFSSCQQNLITNKELLQRIDERIERRKEWLPQMPSDLTESEREALRFLYAYMPLADAVDHPSELFLRNVQTTLKAESVLNWKVPENIFLHFVLPVRVNNETLDTSRVDFYAELRERIKGMTMQDAILEVNHWCHEKVVYVPSDGRTMAPSALVKNAEGRCGEESTFVVSALRAVGIPARQVYTPRWAHTDSNHAWVEAWADGEWYYIGACEPMPTLNSGWFDAPAARAMLMHTKVFGDYYSEDEVINRTDSFTEINITKNYADVTTIEVKVVDSDGHPVSGAMVDFGIYNYAEFFPAVRKKCDSGGRVTLTAGLGTMLISSADGDNYGFVVVNLRDEQEVILTLDNPLGTADIDAVPPVEKEVVRDVTPEQSAENQRRLAEEDEVRGRYIVTFATRERAYELALEIGADSALVARYLLASRGNHNEIASFLKEISPEQLPVALDLLGVVAGKDLLDTPAEVFRNHLEGAYPYHAEKHFKEYILNPRVKLELLTPYRNELQSREQPADAVALITTARNIQLLPELNPAGLWITPLGVHHSRMADRAALETYIVALLRTNGIAARHEPLTENPQYYDKQTERWINITPLLRQNSEPQNKKTIAKGRLKLIYNGEEDVKYYTHFSISRLINGAFRKVEISRSSTTATGGNPTSYATLFDRPMELEEGVYCLTSGTRLANGAVLARRSIFRIEAGLEANVELVMRQDEGHIRVISEMDPEASFTAKGETQPTTILSATGRGYFVLAIIAPNQEPTSHAVRDLVAMREFFNNWGRSILLLTRDKEQLTQFEKRDFGELPKTVILGYDHDGKITQMMVDNLKMGESSDLPIFIIADTFGRVVFKWQGYRVGLAEQMKRVIDRL